MSNRKKWKKSIKFKSKIRKDNIFHSYWLRKFLNKVTKHGKKYRAENIILNMFLEIKKLRYPLNLFFDIVFRSKWSLDTHLKRLGKYFHNIPTYIPFPRNYNRGLSKIVKVARFVRKEKSFSKRLYAEICDIQYAPKKSCSLRLKRQRLKLVQKNRVYSNFRWM